MATFAPTTDHPTITRIEWTQASTVLGHEERGFSAWLGENLWLLEGALGLDALELVDREVRVDTYRADLIATADDGTEAGLPVIVENQYGQTNHDHLGKLVTYLAAWQRGLGVWIVEEATDAHVAAVEFLNRTSSSEVGYALLVVRFAQAPHGGYYVHPDVLARPNAWVHTGSQTTRRRATPERLAFLDELHQHVNEPLQEAGWSYTGPGAAKPYIRLRLPQGHPLQRSNAVLRAAPDELTFRFNVRAGSLDASIQAVALLRERYADHLDAALPTGTQVQWHTGRQRANAATDQITIAHPDGGYQELGPQEAAEWAVQVGRTWVRLLLDDPPNGLLEQARQESEKPAEADEEEA